LSLSVAAVVAVKKRHCYNNYDYQTSVVDVVVAVAVIVENKYTLLWQLTNTAVVVVVIVVTTAVVVKVVLLLLLMLLLLLQLL
jgi:hypothetical protein